MKEEIVSNKNFVSSAFSISAFASLVGGEGLSEWATGFSFCSDSPSPPTSHNYCQSGLLTGSTLGSVTDSYTYNSFGEVSNYTAAYPLGLSCQISYTRDAIGRITGKTENINTIVTSWGYTYDLAGRLTQTTKNGDLWANYTYDTNGNRIGPIAATYDAQDRMTAYGNYTYSYTANGELSSKTNTSSGQTTTYAYDVLGNLKSIVLPDGTQIDYLVDGRNRRVGKKVGGVLQKQWIYDGQLRPVAELDGTGALVSQFVYATHINIPDYMINGGVTYRILTDHLGSLRFVIDTATGTIAQRMDYDDWGNVITNTNADFTPFGFAGGIYDWQTKLVRFGARDFDAEVGRWTCKDPIGLRAGFNIYKYVGDNPVKYLDPSGLACLSYDDLAKLVARYNMSMQSNELIICVIWKESGTGGGVDPTARNTSAGDARGLMQLTKQAVEDVSCGYVFDETLYNAATNIQVGSAYLQMRIDWANGNVANGLNGYGTGPGYSDGILKCEKCLKGCQKGCDTKSCLEMTHK